MIRRPPSSALFPSTTLSRSAYWGISPLADQSTAGAIMMVWGTFIALGTFAYLFFRTANQGIERQRLLDLASSRSEEHTSELQSRQYLVCRLLLAKKTLSLYS